MMPILSLAIFVLTVSYQINLTERHLGWCQARRRSIYSHSKWRTCCWGVVNIPPASLCLVIISSCIGCICAIVPTVVYCLLASRPGLFVRYNDDTEDNTDQIDDNNLTVQEKLSPGALLLTSEWVVFLLASLCYCCVLLDLRVIRSYKWMRQYLNWDCVFLFLGNLEKGGRWYYTGSYKGRKE